LVALAVPTGSHAAWNAGSYRSEPSTLTAAADIFGPANLTERSSGYKPSDLHDVFGGSERWKLVQASPTHYVAPNAPPMLVIQGADDTTVLKAQSVELYRDLKAAGDTTQFVLVRNMGHMFVQVGPKPIEPNVRSTRPISSSRVALSATLSYTLCIPVVPPWR